MRAVQVWRWQYVVEQQDWRSFRSRYVDQSYLGNTSKNELSPYSQSYSITIIIQTIIDYVVGKISA